MMKGRHGFHAPTSMSQNCDSKTPPFLQELPSHAIESLGSSIVNLEMEVGSVDINRSQELEEHLRAFPVPASSLLFCIYSVASAHAFLCSNPKFHPPTPSASSMVSLHSSVPQ